MSILRSIRTIFVASFFYISRYKSVSSQQWAVVVIWVGRDISVYKDLPYNKCRCKQGPSNHCCNRSLQASCSVMVLVLLTAARWWLLRPIVRSSYIPIIKKIYVFETTHDLIFITNATFVYVYSYPTNINLVITHKKKKSYFHQVLTQS